MFSVTSPKPDSYRMSLYKLAVVLRLLNERVVCARLPNTSNMLLLLSATLYLNINLLPFCLLQCNLSVRSGTYNSVEFPGGGIF